MNTSINDYGKEFVIFADFGTKITIYPGKLNPLQTFLNLFPFFFICFWINFLFLFAVVHLVLFERFVVRNAFVSVLFFRAWHNYSTWQSLFRSAQCIPWPTRFAGDGVGPRCEIGSGIFFIITNDDVDVCTSFRALSYVRRRCDVVKMKRTRAGAKESNIKLGESNGTTLIKIRVVNLHKTDTEPSTTRYIYQISRTVIRVYCRGRPNRNVLNSFYNRPNSGKDTCAAARCDLVGCVRLIDCPHSKRVKSSTLITHNPSLSSGFHEFPSTIYRFPPTSLGTNETDEYKRVSFRIRVHRSSGWERNNFF